MADYTEPQTLDLAALGAAGGMAEHTRLRDAIRAARYGSDQ